MTGTAIPSKADGREKTIDELFDEGADLTPYIVEGSIRFPGREADEQRRINLNMPAWLVDEIDAKARHLATNRQSLINITMAESLR